MRLSINWTCRLNEPRSSCGRSSSHPLALCLLDLDGFKGVNDRLGHPAGDEVLHQVATILQRFRLADDCFRIGGDEFAILMSETTLEEAGIAAGSNLDGEALLAAVDADLLRRRIDFTSAVWLTEI